MFDVRVQRGNDCIVLVLGSVDLTSAEDLYGRLRVELLQAGCRSLAVDLADTTFLSFEGLGALLSAHELAVRHGKRLEVSGAQGQPSTVLDLSGLGPVLTAVHANSATA